MPVYADEVTGEFVIRDEVFETMQDLFDFIERATEESEMTGVVPCR